MLRSSLYDYSSAYILVEGTVTVTNATDAGATANNTNTKVIFENCAPFINCISRINKTQVDDAHNIDVVMPMYNSGNYSKKSGISWKYCKDEPAVDVNDTVIDFNDTITTKLFALK